MIVFSKKAYDYLKYELFCFQKKETGGIFLGYFGNNMWNIMETIFPGPNALHESASFDCDNEYVNYEVNKIANMYDNTLHILGLWHTHIISSPLSLQDIKTNRLLASANSFGAISLLIDIEKQSYVFYTIESTGKHNQESNIVVLDNGLSIDAKEIPFSLF